MLDDDMKMEALSDTNTRKVIITLEGKIDLERKGRQSVQGDLYCRLMGFGNGSLTALYDKSDGFYRRQIVLQTRDKDENRVDDRTLAALKLSEALSTEEGETVTLEFSSSQKNADGTTDIRLHIESDQYRFGQELDELRFLTGRVFQNVIVLPSSCVYQKEQGEDAPSYVRQVTETGLLLSELEVKTGYSDGNLICVSGISEGGWYDTGYKAVTEGKSP